jgi:CRP/FNR family transcriptional regulator, cyclic AMP receptor protein
MAHLGKEDRLAVIAAAFGCDGQVAATIDSHAQYLTHGAQTTILLKGDDSEHACLLLAGRAQAVSYSVSGQMILLFTYGPGDLFGESAALGGAVGAVAGNEVVATAASEVGHFTNTIFIGLIERYGAVALAVSRLLTRRLGQTTRRMIEASTLSTVGRIHTELLRQARQQPDLTIRPIPVMSEFALLVQSTRETVSRAINQLEKRGIIRREAGGLTLVAPHRLEDEII